MEKQTDDYLDPRPRLDLDGGLDPIPREDLMLLTHIVRAVAEEDLLSPAPQALLWGLPSADLTLDLRTERVPPAEA